MTFFLRQKYKEKSQAWGPVESVQRSLAINAERIGIDYKKIALAMPMWGPGKQADYSIKNRIFTPGVNVSFEKNTIKTVATSTGYIDLGSSFNVMSGNFTVVQSCLINTIDAFSISSRTGTNGGV